MKFVYFAAVREALEMDEEVRVVPPEIDTIAQLLDQMSTESAAYQRAFADRAKLRFALDQVMAHIDAPLADTHELAIFPPVTGG